MSVAHLHYAQVLPRPPGVSYSLRREDVTTDLLGTSIDRRDKKMTPLPEGTMAYLDSLDAYIEWIDSISSEVAHNKYRFEECNGSPAVDLETLSNMAKLVYLDINEADELNCDFYHYPCQFFGVEYFPHWLHRIWVDVMVAPWDARI